MKPTFILLVLFYFVLKANAQVTFQKIIGGQASTYMNDGRPTSDGGYILCGYTTNFEFSPQAAYMIKLDNHGDTLWTRMFGGSSISSEAQSVQETYDGGYIFSGRAFFPDPPGAEFVIKTDADGDTLWTKIYGSSISYINSVLIEQTIDSGYVIAGNNGYTYSHLLKLDKNGVPQWNRIIAGNGDKLITGVKQTTDSGFILCGNTRETSGTGPFDVFLIKTKANGDSMWARQYESPGDDRSAAVLQAKDGGYVITGTMNGTNFNAAFLIKTDAEGDTLWTKTYPNTNNTMTAGYGIDTTRDGGYIVTGNGPLAALEDPPGFLQQILLIKTDATGDTMWTRYLGSTDEGGNAVHQTADGGYFITGTEYIFTFPETFNGYLVKTDEMGHSGCYENSTNLAVSNFPVQANHSNTVVSVYDVNFYANTMEINRGGNDSTLCLTVGVNELKGALDNIYIYPNPASKELRINSAGVGEELRMKIASCKIFNVLGETVLSSLLLSAADETLIDISSFPSGLYFLRMSDKKEIWTGKFIKE